MTSTITPETTTSPLLSDPLLGAVPLEPGAGGDPSPRRRRARFPEPVAAGTAPGSGARPAVRWVGAPGPLRDLVRDHAMAVGLEVTDADRPPTADAETDAAGGLPAAADDPAGPAAASLVCVVAESSALLSGTAGDRSGGRARHAGAAIDLRAVLEGSSRPELLVVSDSEEISPAVWEAALAAGARAVLPIPARSEDLLSLLAELARPRPGSVIVGVVGGCGGAGASSFAARLAGASRRHGPVTLIDADPLGGGTDLLVEAPPLEGIRWQDVASLGPDDGEALRAGLPCVDGVHLLLAGHGTGPDPTALAQVLMALTPLDGTVVVDLCASLVPAVRELLQSLLVVIPGQDHAVRAAARRLRAWDLTAPLAEIVVRRRGPLTAREVAEDLALPLAGAFRDSPHGAVPLLDVRRGGADRTARAVMTALQDRARS